MKNNLGAVNLNNRDYYVTGITRWDNGRELYWDNFVTDPVVCPLTERFNAYTITTLTCEALNAEQHEAERFRTEEHCSKMLDELGK